MPVLALFRILALSAACAGLASCSVSYDSAISGPLEEPTITFPRADGEPAQFCLDDLQVRAEGVVIWYIAMPSDECRLLESVTFGQTPAGFVGGAPTTALQADIEYEVSGRGWTRSGIPWYGHGSAVFKNGQWRATRS